MATLSANKESVIITDLDDVSKNGCESKSDEESVKSNSKKSDTSLDWSLKGLTHLKQSFRSFSVPKKGIERDKNEPAKFFGDGVTFKAKLIGILEVEDARGDRMCQDALNELKMAVRAAGEHKQRINIVISIEGLRLRDEKTGDCLYHHPVHKISFIAQDVADSRAFGYIFGSPDSGHRFFGIKTDKAASQVVIAMRDLFQVVYELKKREVEAAKQNIEQHQLRYGSNFFLDSLSAASSKSGSDSLPKTKPSKEDTSKGSVKHKTQTAGVIADLMDLELELNSLQQGLNQMERLTPSDPFCPPTPAIKDDPFGDSFTSPPCTSTPPPTKLPPPPTSGDRRKMGSSSSVPTTGVTSTTVTATTSSSFAPSTSTSILSKTPIPCSIPVCVAPLTTGISTIAPSSSDVDLHWFDKETRKLFGDNNFTTQNHNSEQKSESNQAAGDTLYYKPSKDLFDIFTELDPLGTGKSKPYVDKKDFFQELKNPPKKILKDIAGNEGEGNSSPGGSISFKNAVDNEPEENTSSYTGNTISATVDTMVNNNVCFSTQQESPHISTNMNTFHSEFADFGSFDKGARLDRSNNSPRIGSRKSPLVQSDSCSSQGSNNGLLKRSPLQLPNRTRRSSDEGVHSVSPQDADSPVSKTTKNHRWNRSADSNKKQKIVINLRRVLSSADDTDKENDSPVMEDGGIVLRNPDVQSPDYHGDDVSSNFDSGDESIPEPPPRPITSPVTIQPPPLPPKKVHAAPVTMKPPPRPPSSSENNASSHYDYIENYASLGGGSRQRATVPVQEDVKIPPIPAPARKTKFGYDSDLDSVARHRPQKQSSSSSVSDYYLTPVTGIPGGTVDKSDKAKLHHNYPNTEKINPSLNITLKQLTNADFNELATSLGVSSVALSTMTLKELTECLTKQAQLLEDSSSDRDPRSSSQIQSSMNSKYYSSLKESFDEETPVFKADFETQFANNSNKNNGKMETPVDKYAVFRELIEEELRQQSLRESVSTPESNAPDIFEERDVENNVTDIPDKCVITSVENEEGVFHESPILEEQKPDDIKKKDEINFSKKSSTGRVNDEEVVGPPKIVTGDATTKDSNSEDVANEEIESHADERSKENLVRCKDSFQESRSTPGGDISEADNTDKQWTTFDSAFDESVVRPKSASPWTTESAGGGGGGKDNSSSFDELLQQGGHRRVEIAHKPPTRTKQRGILQPKRWTDDYDDEGADDDYGDDSDENWESSKRSPGSGSSWGDEEEEESSWKENGWSDRDSLYEESPGGPSPSYDDRRYEMRKKGYHQKYSPQKKPPSLPPPPVPLETLSPWEEERRELNKSLVTSSSKRVKPKHKQQQPSPAAAPWYTSHNNERTSVSVPWTRSTGEPPYPSSYEINDDRATAEEEEFSLLKMVLGEKKTKELKEKLYKQFFNKQREKKAAASTRGFQEVFDVKQPPLLSRQEYLVEAMCRRQAVDIEGEREMRETRKQHHRARRPRSAEKMRHRKYRGAESSVRSPEMYQGGEQYRRGRRRPYSQDDLSVSEEEIRWDQNVVKPSSLYYGKKPPSSSGRSRNQSQTSPFEDNFLPSQDYGPTIDRKEITYDQPHFRGGSMGSQDYGPQVDRVGKEVIYDQPHFRSSNMGSSQEYSLQVDRTKEVIYDQPHFRSGSNAGSRFPSKSGPVQPDTVVKHDFVPSTYEYKQSSRNSRESSQRQSPFEDDFTPPDGQSSIIVGGSQVNQDDEDDGRSNDNVFVSRNLPGEPLPRIATRSSSGFAKSSRYESAGRREIGKERPGKHYENVTIRRISSPPGEPYYDRAVYPFKTYDMVGEPAHGPSVSSQMVKSPKKTKPPSSAMDPATYLRHNPFNDKVQQPYNITSSSKTVPRSQKPRMKTKTPAATYDSGSDSSGTPRNKWREDFGSFPFPDQGGHK